MEVCVILIAPNKWELLNNNAYLKNYYNDMGINKNILIQNEESTPNYNWDYQTPVNQELPTKI